MYKLLAAVGLAILGAVIISQKKQTAKALRRQNEAIADFLELTSAGTAEEKLSGSDPEKSERVLH